MASAMAPVGAGTEEETSWHPFGDDLSFQGVGRINQAFDDKPAWVIYTMFSATWFTEPGKRNIISRQKAQKIWRIL